MPPFVGDLPPEPIACSSGELPEDIPQLDRDTCQGAEKYQRATEVYRDLYERSQRRTQVDQTCDEYLADGEEIPPICSEIWQRRATLSHSTPVQLFRQGFPGLTHPFWKIAFHADRYTADDFRSGKAFEAAATNPAVEQLARERNHLTLLYPASGGHLTDFLIPLKLIDKGLIRSAEVIHTEIDEAALHRVDSYMRFFEDQGLFTDVTRTTETKEPGLEVSYEFAYRGKHVRFIFGLNRGGDVYAPDEYIQRADLIVFHDGVYNGPGDRVADAFMEKLEDLSRDDRLGKDRLILSENQWNCPPDGFVCRINEHLYYSEPIEGFYGCTRNHSVDVPHYAPTEGPDGVTSLTKTNGIPGLPNRVHFASDKNSPDQAFLLKTSR